MGKGNPVDDVVLGYGYDDPIADPAHADIGKQPGGVEILDALVDGGLIRAGEISPDRFAIDAFVALHGNACGGVSGESAPSQPSQRDNCDRDPAPKHTQNSHRKTGPYLHES